MNFAKFIFFSSLEPLSFFYFLLVLFRFSVRENIFKFLVVSVVLSLVSHAFQSESLQAWSPLVHAVLCILFVVFFLRVSYLNSVIMVITSYVIYFVIQVALVGFFEHFNVLTVIKPYTQEAYIVQALSSFLMFLFGLYTFLKKGGFSFIDAGSRFKKPRLFMKENRMFVAFLSISLLLLVATNFVSLFMANPPYLFVSILLLLSMVVLLSLSIKRDESSG